jgi:hypothetical protein
VADLRRGGDDGESPNPHPEIHGDAAPREAKKKAMQDIIKLDALQKLINLDSG